MIAAAQDQRWYDRLCDELSDEPVDDQEPSDNSRLYALLDAALDYRAEAVIWCAHDDYETDAAVARWFDAQSSTRDDLKIALSRDAKDGMVTLLVTLNHARIVTLYIR